MLIKGKVHLLFEQSGTFKNEFIKLGYPSEDYDLQNGFGQTDHIVDLFAEINKAYKNESSIFDKMSSDDLLIAFFPCIFFCSTSQMAFSLGQHNYKRLSDTEKIDKILQRSHNRQVFYNKLLQLVGVSFKKNLRLIIENPWSAQTYLRNNFLKYPDVVDSDRSRRGDLFKKPTAYWFFNCQPTFGESFEPSDKVFRVHDFKPSKKAGTCSIERSMMTPAYAKNWIKDFILGEEYAREI